MIDEIVDELVVCSLDQRNNLHVNAINEADEQDKI
jgi:hypothetical protein